MSETKTREPLVLSPLEDEPAIENLPEPIPLTPEQLAAQAEADERDRQRRFEVGDDPAGAQRQLDGGDAGDVAVVLA